MKINFHKILSCFIALSILCFFVFTPFFSSSASAAYDPSKQSFGAWIATAITALNIALSPVGAVSQDIANFIADPFDVTYTYSEENLNSYFDQSNIQIVENGTLIDGVYYDDVWLSHDAAEKFRTNAFDFQTAYSLVSNSNGTFASGNGFYGDTPIFNLGNNQFYSQNYSIPRVLGTYSVPPASVAVTSIWGSNRLNFTATFPSGSSPATISGDMTSSEFLVYRFEPGNPSKVSMGVMTAGGSYYRKGYVDYSLYDPSPFDFDWVSGTIPAEQDFSQDDGLLIHIPHGQSPDFDDFISDNPEFLDPGGVTVDPSIDPDIYTKLGDIANILAPIIPIINAEFTDAVPYPQPVPSQVTIADQQYNILQSALDGIQTVLESIWQSILSIPSSISSLVQPILEDIEIAPIKVFDKALDLISTLFAPIFALIRSGLSVWSYVVSWLNSISAPLTFIFSCLSSTPIILYPVYAVVAATLCIAIWRRFGH